MDEEYAMCLHERYRCSWLIVPGALSDSIHDKFLGLVDLKALEPIPAIIDSAYARVDPAVATIYYFLINIGWHQDVSAEPYWGSVIYNLCIRDLPDWDHMETYSDLDLAAVTVTVRYEV